jgi:(S)-ureidoglycine aminohydrolase
MKNVCIALLILIPISASAQNMLKEVFAPLQSIKYSWQNPVEKEGKNLLSTVLFQGQGYDMEYVQVSACEVRSSKKKTEMRVPLNEEHLIIIKSGHLNISFKDSTWSLTPGSIALLMPDEKFAIQNPAKDPGRYYLMKYRSKSAPDPERGKASGGSFVREWNRLAFRKHDRGGVRAYFEIGTPMSKRFEMHVTTLNAGLKSHDPHTHRAEEIILMLEDTGGPKAKTEMLIGDSSFKGEAGDLYYVGSNLLHGIRNTGEGPCSYFAFQFE